MIQVVFTVSFLVFLKWNICYGQGPCTIPTGYEGVTCACEIPGQGIFDLRSIANNDGSPRFTDISYGDFLYSYNPCYGYNQGSPGTACGGDLGQVSSCQYRSDDPTVSYSLGSPDNENIYTDGSNTYLEYDGGQDGRITRVYLSCDESAADPSITTTGDSGQQLVYVFYLTTKYACPSTDPPSPPPDGPTGPSPSTWPPSQGGLYAFGIVALILGILSLVIGIISAVVLITAAVIIRYRKRR
jgi:hypothetical protein